MACGCWGTETWVSFPQPQLCWAIPAEIKKEIITLPHASLHFTALALWIYNSSYFHIYSHVQTSPRLGRKGSSFPHGSGPSQEFFLGVNVTEMQRPNSWLHLVPLLCSILALQRGCKSDPKSQLNLFSGTGGRIIKTRLFPLEKTSFILFKRRMSCNEILQLP